MIPRLIAAVWLTVSLAACAANAPPTCRITRVVDLPLLRDTSIPAVEASLEGQRVLILIDTGAYVSLITRKAADHFNLRAGPESGYIRVVGIGGTVNARLVKVPNLVLGRGTARDLELPVAGDLGGPIQGIPVLGVFGADFLSSYDVDLDVPGHHFAMFQLQSCGPTMHPLEAPAFDVPFQYNDSKITLDLKLNGKPVTGFLDTGASRTMVPPGMASEVGVRDIDLSADRSIKAHGIDEAELESRVHRFGSLDIGDETMNNFPFIVADTNISDLILGNDFLRENHVWISYPLHRLYIQPVAMVPSAPPVPPPPP